MNPSHKQQPSNHPVNMTNIQIDDPVVKKKPSPFYVAAVVSFYIISTISMVLVNKVVLKNAGLPFTFLWGQLALASVVLQACQLCGVFKMPSFAPKTLIRLIPLIAINVVGLSLNTLCLYYADAMMYQIARSLVLPITVALTPLMLHDSVSLKVIACCLIVTAGFTVGLFGERSIKVSALGIVFGLLSSLSTALHSIVIKQAFGKIPENSPFDMVYYNNVLSTIVLLPTLAIEARPLLDMVTGKNAMLKPLLIGTTVAGLMGLLVNFAAFLQIKVTSPLTHVVASASRGVLQSLAAFFLLHEKINVARGIGIGVTLTGSVLYSVVKNFEKKPPTSNNYKIVPEPQTVKQ